MRRVDQISPVSNPLRLEGNRFIRPPLPPLSYVSNPLRLEGNGVSVSKPSLYDLPFLIHYGWRGTKDREIIASVATMFLIHYGWRGT